MAQSRPVPLACLPWYDFEEIQHATDAFWSYLAGELLQQGFADVPARLLRGIDHDRILMRPDLLLSQTCGYVVVGPARRFVELVATPCYTAPGCSDSAYRSFVVVAAASPARELADLFGSRCAVNEPLSHSGVNALRGLVAPLNRDGRFFSEIIVSGSHVRSFEHVAAGHADVAAIDCVTYELVRRWRPALVAATRLLTQTLAAPAPPFVTAVGDGHHTVGALRQALGAFFADPSQDAVRQALLLRGVEVRPLSCYESMLAYERAACAAGYREMAWSAACEWQA
jgi:ABC-type phosphate/phosphonate transport system substrate-binding protein